MAQPDIVFRHGVIHAAIFTKEITRGDRIVQTRSVLFQKRFKDKNGEWKTSSHLEVDDLPKAVLVLNKAYDYLTSSGYRDAEVDEQ